MDNLFPSLILRLMKLDDIKTIVEIAEKIITSISVLIGGIWVYYRFILQRERYPNINFECDVVFIGKQNDEWLIEITATLDNKGKAQHIMDIFTFSLDGIHSNEQFIHLEKWNGQANFPYSIKKGTFLNPHYKYFYIDPGTTAKYSYIIAVPTTFSYLLLHCMFKYKEGNKMHVAEKTVKVPEKLNDNFEKPIC